MTVINPFDLERIFVNILSGSPQIFTGLAMLFVSSGAAYFRMSDRIFMLMVIIFSIIMSVYIGPIYAVIILLVGIVTFFSISRMFNR